MEAHGMAAILQSIAWPSVALTVALLFRKPLAHLAESVSLKAIKLKVLGAEVELTPEQAKTNLQELLTDILQTINELPPDVLELFGGIEAAGGRSTVEDLVPGFSRDSHEHQSLRTLRDRQLIRPFEGGSWQAKKHPVTTHFGELVWRMRPQSSAVSSS
jgi:hypothetical protein